MVASSYYQGSTLEKDQRTSGEFKCSSDTANRTAPFSGHRNELEISLDLRLSIILQSSTVVVVIPVCQSGHTDRQALSSYCRDTG